MAEKQNPPEPVHQPGTQRGEEAIKDLGKEPGRKADNRDKGEEEAESPGYRSGRDASSVSPQDPIDPKSTKMPPD